MENRRERRDSEIRVLDQTELNRIHGGVFQDPILSITNGQTFNVICSTCGYKTPHSLTSDGKLICNFCGTVADM